VTVRQTEPDGGQSQDDQQQDDQGGGSLLEESADDLNDDGQQQQEGDDDGQQQTQGVDVAEIVSQLEERLGARFDAIADRRVNQLLRRQRQGGQGSGGQQRSQQQQEESPPTSSPEVVRATRLAFREYVADEVKFISSEERAFAMDLGAALMAQEANRGIEDEDEVGRRLAKDVAQRVKTLRKHYEDRTVAALKRKGLLPEKEGQPLRSVSGPKGTQTEFEKGAELAKQRFGGRLPSQQS